MGVASSLDVTSSLDGRKASPDADPKGKKPSKNKNNVRPLLYGIVVSAPQGIPKKANVGCPTAHNDSPSRSAKHNNS